MADGVAISAGVGTTVATDDVSGVHYQRVKLVDGTLDATGAIGGDATNGLDVDVTRVIPGTSATHLGKAEDAAHAGGDTGVMALGVRRSDANALTALAGTDDDYTPFTVDTRGVQLVVPRPYVLRSRVVSSGLTTASTAYIAGDQMGAIFTFASAAKLTGGTGVIQSVVVLDKADVITDLRLHFFRASVTLASDNAAFSVSDSDMESYVGTVTPTVALDVGANRVATAANVGLGYDCSATSLYCAVETRAGHTFFGAATDLHVTVHLLLD